MVIVVGDEAGENGAQFADAFKAFGYDVSAMALIVNVAVTRGQSVRRCAEALGVPFSQVTVEQFSDPYQVPRVLKALLDAPRMSVVKQHGLVERVMATPLLTL